ncbi:MAG: hydantoinase/oxoprolinase family protein [Sphingomonadales bacterium]|nr:hydantoinase/oxoprolinase family protein [Sphingomonadales bacterium]
MKRDVLIGIDVGGTFTDAVVIVAGRPFRAKSPSTYPRIGEGVLASCRLAARAAGADLDTLLPRVRRFGLGTTAVTNVIATRTGLKVGLLTTKGFEETLRLARGRTQEVDGWLQSVDALVDRRMIAGIDERIDRNGVVLRALDAAEVLAEGRRLAAQGAQSLAVSFLWSFHNPVHEAEALRLLRAEFPGLPVTGGAELRPVIREYERTTLAVLNAYAHGAYAGVEGLAEELRAGGLEAPVLLCHSGGGAISIPEAREQPVWLAASGPAAGVAAAASIARMAGEDRVLTGDLGGTSFDVAHLADGAPARTQRGNLMGFWTALPRVDVESVGAGGGSLAWADERGMLRVGPRSAGSSPGPVCYGRGGTQPALTDALLALGYLDPARFLGGAMALDGDGAVAALAGLGAPLGLAAVETAWGVRALALAEMVKAVRARLSSHALAAAEHCLVSYGGCGALFAAEVARNAGLKRVLVPELASVLSAYGAATMDIRRERLASVLKALPCDAGLIDATLDGLGQQAGADLAADGVPEAARTVRFEADMRFFGQRWELAVALPEAPAVGDGGAQMEALFRAEYLRRFGAAATTGSGVVELVGIRAIGIGRMAVEEVVSAGGSGSAAPVGQRAVQVVRDGGPSIVAVYDAGALGEGAFLPGPALIDSQDTTIWIPGGMAATMLAGGTLAIEVRA